jgi:tripartite-type tricarboxylate transporter receptor subunit TctC
MLCAVSFFPGASWAADAQQYPARPIRLVVPFAPGGGSDYNARLVGAHIRERLGQNVIVDNRPGAGGSTGAETVIRSTPDGYTILLISMSYLLNSIMYKTSYDPVEAVTPIINIQAEPSLIVVNPKVPVNNVKELIERARQKPNDLTFGSAGMGSSAHLGWELFMDTF